MKYWWDKSGLRFECVMCGKCCGGEPGSVWVNEQETSLIGCFLNINLHKLRKDFLVRKMGKLSIKEKENFDCIFLNSENHKCEIYQARPIQCRTFPFWETLLLEKEAWDFYAERCPGMNNGKNYTPDEIKKIITGKEHEE